LLIGEANAKKRVYRAKRQLAEQEVVLEVPPADRLGERLESVHRVLYLTFNEGYNASSAEQPIREELCEEAARLCHLLCQHQHCSTPATRALLALMLFHAARLDARHDGHGSLILLEDQDRAKWDRRLLEEAAKWLDRSAVGDAISCYHLEAGIVMQHCLAESVEATDWRAIVKLYDALLRVQWSPVYALNRAIALSQIEGPQAGLAALEEIVGDARLEHYHLLDAARGELHCRNGDAVLARQFFLAARNIASPAERRLLDAKLARLDG
jgi:RNA polymerase sigma-70 factor (ECF subfamily)